MLKILGEYYYIDLDIIQDMVNFDAETTSGTTEQHISVVKYDMIKVMIDVIMTEREDVDESLGPKSDASIPFKIAFNTLLNNKIIKQY
jgi:hypothetical protein